MKWNSERGDITTDDTAINGLWTTTVNIHTPAIK